MTLLPEVAERDAPPEIAAIYDEMRRFTRLPLVNLIYRHLATIPGALPWAWSLLPPAFADGSLEAAAARVHAALSFPSLDPITPAMLEGSGLSGADREQADQVIAAYNRGNSLNLIGLTAVRLALDSRSVGAGYGHLAAAPAISVPVIPPIRRLGDLDPDLAATVTRLAELHAGGASGVIPSLYLHLANWPGLLALVAERVRPLLENGTIARAGQEAASAARRQAEKLLPSLSASSPPPAEHADALRRVLDSFTGLTIPQMMCLGMALSRAMPPP